MKIIFFIFITTACFASDTAGFSSELEAVEKACERNMATACFEFAELYAEGTGVKKDLSKARLYYLKACDYGYDKGCQKFEKLQVEN